MPASRGLACLIPGHPFSYRDSPSADVSSGSGFRIEFGLVAATSVSTICCTGQAERL